MRETEIVTIVPAQPGWSLAIYVEGGKEPDGKEYAAGFTLEQIIAWEIERKSGPFHPSAGRPGEKCVSRYVTPITVDSTDVETLSNQWAIRRPDGVYIAPGDRVLGTEAEAVADYTAWAEKRRTERKTA